MTASYHLTHLRLRDAASEAVGAHWVPSKDKPWRIKGARKELLMALAACAAGFGPDQARSTLIDLIAMAIVDSTDIDCTAESQAEAVLAAILNNCLPMPEDAE